MKTICVTGHRTYHQLFKRDPSSLLWATKELCDAIDRAIDAGFTNFISGGALGIDTIFVQHVLVRRQIHPSIKLTIARPHMFQHKSWNEYDQYWHMVMLQQADYVFNVNSGDYEPHHNFTRNQWMVDRSDVVLAVIGSDVQRGGTFNTVRYATRKNKKVFYIYPDTHKTIWVT